MKKSKAKFWIILWLIVIVLCTVLGKVEQVAYYFQNGVELKSPPYTFLQLVFLFGIAPFALLPMLFKAFSQAVQEKRKWLKILAGILIFHHILCIVLGLFTALDLI